MDDNTGLKRYWLAAGLGALLALFVLAAQFAGAFDSPEQPFLDLRQSLPSLNPSPDRNKQLALVAIDYISAERPWPWPRLDYVILLRSLLPFAPKSVVFEPLLHDRDTRYGAFDSTFGNLVNRLDHVVFAAAVLIPDSPNSTPANLVSIPTRGSLGNMPRFNSSLWPLDTFAGNASVGISNLMPETNGQVRRLPLLFLYKNQALPSLSLQAVIQYLDADPKKSEVLLGHEIHLRSRDGTLLRSIPIDEQGRLQLRFRENASAFWTVSFPNVPVFALQRERGESPETDLTELRGRQIWVGRTDHKDLPPIGNALPNLSPVELQMLGTSNILNNDFIRNTPAWALVFLYLLFASLSSAFLLRYGWINGGVLEFLLVSVWWETSFLLFRAASINLPIVSFTLLAIGIAGVAYAAQEWDLKPSEGNQLTLKLK
jgi:adenylate cyclase